MLIEYSTGSNFKTQLITIIMTGKTLQIYLPGGTPSGIRIAELTTRTIQAISIPKTRLSKFYNRPEACHVGTYFLFGGDDKDTKPIVYIGQSENLVDRLKSHDSNKDFWNTAVVVDFTNTFSHSSAHPLARMAFDQNGERGEPLHNNQW